MYVDTAYSYSLSVCMLVCHDLEPAKTAEPIQMPFGLWTRVGPGNHVLDGDPDPNAKINSEGGRAGHCKG